MGQQPKNQHCLQTQQLRMVPTRADMEAAAANAGPPAANPVLKARLGRASDFEERCRQDSKKLLRPHLPLSHQRAMIKLQCPALQCPTRKQGQKRAAEPKKL